MQLLCAIFLTLRLDVHVSKHLLLLSFSTLHDKGVLIVLKPQCNGEFFCLYHMTSPKLPTSSIESVSVTCDSGCYCKGAVHRFSKCMMLHVLQTLGSACEHLGVWFRLDQSKSLLCTQTAQYSVIT